MAPKLIAERLNVMPRKPCEFKAPPPGSPLAAAAHPLVEAQPPPQGLPVEVPPSQQPAQEVEPQAIPEEGPVSVPSDGVADAQRPLAQEVAPGPPADAQRPLAQPAVAPGLPPQEENPSPPEEEAPPP